MNTEVIIITPTWVESATRFRANVKLVFTVAFITAALCYSLFLVNGYTLPDGLCEGMLRYTGTNWALSIGRWAIRLWGLGTMRIVMPLFIVSLCTLCNAMTVLLLAELWNIQNKLSLVIATVAMIASPAVAIQFLYVYMALAFGFALLLSTVSAYLVLTRKSKWSFIGAALALAVALGSYQSYVGFTGTIILLTLMLWLIRGEQLHTSFKRFARGLLMSICGCLLYLVILKVNLVFFQVQLASYSGADSIGFINTLTNLLPSVKSEYRDFFSYYSSSLAWRNLFFVPILALVASNILYHIGKRLKKSDWAGAVCLLVGALTLPVTMNLISIIAPERSISVIMSQQMQLILPFSLTLLSVKCVKGSKEYVRRALSLIRTILVVGVC